VSRLSFSAGTAKQYNYHIAFKNLPEAFSGFKIAHISDPHSKPAKGVLEIVEGTSPDITVITGDLLNDDEKSTAEIDELVSSLLEISPVYFISGNHDLWRVNHKGIFRKYEEMGAVFMDNKTVFIEKNGEKIAISGVPDPFSRVPEKISENTKKSLKGIIMPEGFNILLFHRANLFDQIKNYGYDLILSGHMHGGQIRIPKLGGVLAPSSAMLSKKRMLFPEFTGGVVTSKECTMVVNRGIGNTLPLPRLGNAPEVGIITLLKD